MIIISVGQQDGDTCLGEERSWCTCHKSTHYTQHNLQIKSLHKHIATINTHKKKNMNAICGLNIQIHLACFLVVNYMHDAMNNF
jgi:hypothetical protein